jgi:signal transduction histidine kinase
MIKSISEGTGRIKKIVEGLRGFAHMSGTSFLKSSINDAIDDTLTIVWNVLKYKTTIKKDYGELPQVSCNIGEIKQVLVNLLVNAAHSINEKGDINISTYQEGESVCIKIKDTGCGISQENLKRIFDPFFTTKPVGKGTGLGLWISSSIIEKHTGLLTVDSKVGEGSSFTIKLPIEQKVAESEIKET